MEFPVSIFEETKERAEPENMRTKRSGFFSPIKNNSTDNQIKFLKIIRPAQTFFFLKKKKHVKSVRDLIHQEKYVVARGHLADISKKKYKFGMNKKGSKARGSYSVQRTLKLRSLLFPQDILSSCNIHTFFFFLDGHNLHPPIFGFGFLFFCSVWMLAIFVFCSACLLAVSVFPLWFDMATKSNVIDEEQKFFKKILRQRLIWRRFETGTPWISFVRSWAWLKDVIFIQRTPSKADFFTLVRLMAPTSCH